MPRMDNTGPEGKGSGSGRKLGFCQSPDPDNKESGIFGIGLGRRFHAPAGSFMGRGKRLKYFQDKQI